MSSGSTDSPYYITVAHERTRERPTAKTLSEDQIFRGAVIALSDLRRTPEDHPLYGAYRSAAGAWVNEAQERLAQKR